MCNAMHSHNDLGKVIVYGFIAFCPHALSHTLTHILAHAHRPTYTVKYTHTLTGTHIRP